MKVENLPFAAGQTRIFFAYNGARISLKLRFVRRTWRVISFQLAETFLMTYIVSTSVLDPNTLNLDPDPEICYSFCKKF